CGQPAVSPKGGERSYVLRSRGQAMYIRTSIRGMEQRLTASIRLFDPKCCCLTSATTDLPYLIPNTALSPEFRQTPSEASGAPQSLCASRGPTSQSQCHRAKRHLLCCQFYSELWYPLYCTYHTQAREGAGFMKLFEHHRMSWNAASTRNTAGPRHG